MDSLEDYARKWSKAKDSDLTTLFEWMKNIRKFVKRRIGHLQARTCLPMMLIDFCDPRLQPRIFSDKVSVDGYETSNLVSSDFFTRQKGFIAEYFIKPPVNVTVAFPFNVELYRVVIDPVVGRQRSNGFEIFTCSNKVAKSWLDSTGQVTSSDIQESMKSSVFNPIGKTFLREPGKVCFQNVLHRSWGDWNVADMENISTYPNRKDLRHHRISSLNFVSHVTVRITSSQGGSAVCLRKLEIWGQPSISSPKALVTRIKELILCQNSDKSKIVMDIKPTTETVAAEKTERIHDVIEENGVEIPPDFLDKITCELMTVPMLLPSGENIDLSSLEKHNASEATWGRPPGDPFTGIAFHSNSHAVPNVHLKTRIDQFLLANSEKLQHLPRTLGREKDSAINGPSTSRLITDETTQSQSVTPRNKADPVNKVKVTSSKKRQLVHTQMESCPKRKKINKNKPELHLTTHSDVQIQNLHSSVAVDSMTDRPLCSDSSCGSEGGKDLNSEGLTVSHDDSLKFSLNTALASTLGTLPSFTKFTTQKVKSDKGGYSDTCFTNGVNSFRHETKCRYCDKVDSGPLYKGSCPHLVCRGCLTATTVRHLKCGVCGNVTDRSEMTRTYK